MDYRILALGDVASETGLQLLEKKLRTFKREQNVAFTVVNGENISGTGLTRAQAEDLLAAGADVVTLGNHTFGKPQIATFLDESGYILRPANFTGRAAGRGLRRLRLQGPSPWRCWCSSAAATWTSTPTTPSPRRIAC